MTLYLSASGLQETLHAHPKFLAELYELAVKREKIVEYEQTLELIHASADQLSRTVEALATLLRLPASKRPTAVFCATV